MDEANKGDQSGVGIVALITTYNEEAHIREAIESVLWADEIRVVDSYSTDKTVEYAQQYPKVRVIQHAYENAAAQKNWALEAIDAPWVLILDADERITPELRDEILGTVQSTHTADAYWIGRKNYAWGKPLRFLWRTDKVVRLFRPQRCRYQQLSVHSEIDTRGLRVGRLRHRMLHYTLWDWARYTEKLRRYAYWGALDRYRRGKRSTLLSICLKPLARLIKHLLIEGGVLDGKRGVILSLTMAWTVFMRSVFLYEMHLRAKESFRSSKST